MLYILLWCFIADRANECLDFSLPLPHKCFLVYGNNSKYIDPLYNPQI